MTVIMTPTGSDSGGAVAPARNYRGSATITPGNTVTLASYVSGTHRLRGYSAMGTDDGEVWIEVEGVPLAGLSSRISLVKDAYRVLPNPESFDGPLLTVTLRVKNTGSVSGVYEGVIFNE